jgi:methylated-DNA-[protein]-cysteine S-methyltransferase
MTARLRITTRSTPAGAIRFAAHDDERGAMVALGFEDHWRTLMALLVHRFRDVTTVSDDRGGDAGARIDAYLAGELDAIDAIPVDTGGTPFQGRVWSALRTVPAGETRSYGELAHAIGAPRAVRAVGAANGANPVSIVVPCHRIVAHDGTLHGYGGGLPRKAWLLAHERAASEEDSLRGRRRGEALALGLKGSKSLRGHFDSLRVVVD